MTAALGAGSFILLYGAYQTLKSKRFITDFAVLANTGVPKGPIAGEPQENHGAWLPGGAMMTQKKLWP